MARRFGPRRVPSRRLWLGLALTLVGAVQLAAPRDLAAAPDNGRDPMTENARLHDLFERAGAALDREDYPEAVRLLTEVWKARRTADVAANLAVAELAIGDPVAAGRHAAFARLHLLPSATTDQHDAIESLLARARSEACVLVIRAEPVGAEVRVSGEPIVSEELGELFVAPGEHVVSATANGVTSERRVTAVRGGHQEVELTVPASAGAASSLATSPADVDRAIAPTRTESAAVADAAPRRAHRGALVPLLGGLGVAAVGGGFAIGFGAAARASGADADAISRALGSSESACYGSSDPRCEELAELRDQESNQRGFARAGLVAAGVGAAAALLGGVVYYTSPREARSGRRAPVVAARAAVGPEAARLGVAIQF